VPAGTPLDRLQGLYQVRDAWFELPGQSVTVHPWSPSILRRLIERRTYEKQAGRPGVPRWWIVI